MAIGAWQQHEVEPLHLASGDPEQAAALFRAAFPGITLHPAQDGRRFGLEIDRVGDGRMTVNRLRFSGSATADGSIAAGVGVARVLSGRFALEYGREVVDTSLPYLRPSGRSIATMQDAHVELIELDPQAFVASAYAHLEGTGRTVHLPAADAVGPVPEAPLAAWSRVADLAVSVAFDDAAFASPLIRAGLFDLVVSVLLATFPLTSETGVAGRYGAGPAAIRRAVVFIDEHLAEPLDVGTIAAVARLPVRTLQTAFRAQIGVAPMEHVRLRRLAAAREELLGAESSAGAVAAIAHRWGFTHMARFAEQYRRTYGEKPSETLRH